MNNRSSQLQVINPKEDIGNNVTLLDKPVRIRKLKDAKRLLSRLIHEFQKGTINNRDAKDLCYLIVSFVQIAKDVDLEERINQLEERVN